MPRVGATANMWREANNPPATETTKAQSSPNNPILHPWQHPPARATAARRTRNRRGRQYSANGVRDQATPAHHVTALPRQHSRAGDTRAGRHRSGWDGRMLRPVQVCMCVRTCVCVCGKGQDVFVVRFLSFPSAELQEPCVLPCRGPTAFEARRITFV